MAKKMGYKVQTYKSPPEKFLVVTRAWGLDLRNDLTLFHFNKVGAWFEIMLRDKYPGASVRAIYHQRTHRNLIVELPRQVTDISPYLGRHLHATFLIQEPLSDGYSEIYEYKYSRHGDPAEKSWTTVYPNPQKIPEGIFRSPYPFPTRASDWPPIDIADYAHPIPHDVYTQRQALVDEAIAAASAAATVSVPTPPKFSFIPDDPQPGSSTHKTASTSRLPEPTAKQTSLEVTTEHTDKFLASLTQSCANEENNTRASTEPQEDDYNPSAELLAMLAELPPELNPLGVEQEPRVHGEPDIIVKPEPIDNALPEYAPSEDLLNSLASLPPDIFFSNQHPSKNEVEDELPVFRVKDEPRDITIEPARIRQFPEPDIKVKPEPMDDIPFGHYRVRSRERRSTSHTHEYSPRADSAPVKVEIKSEASIRIKPEPEDNARLTDRPPRKQVKLERDVMEAESSTSRIRRIKAELDESAASMRGLPARTESPVKVEATDHNLSDGFRHPRDNGFDRRSGRGSGDPEYCVNSISHRSFRGKPEPEEDSWFRVRDHEQESTLRDYPGHRVEQPSGYRERPKRESSPPYLDDEKRVRLKREHGEGEPRS